jgi:LysM repeat protein
VRNIKLAFVASALLVMSFPLQAQSLRGSKESMERQNHEAKKYGYTFIRSAASLTSLVDSGQLLRVEPSRNLTLHDVSYPYARPEVKLFLDRLSAQYRVACGEQLTVTSLSRPIDRQPANAASNSVHPTGMAVDLRIPPRGKCRSWLESTLLSLEATDVLDVTRERNPPHYHVAVFTKTYEQYVESRSNPSSQDEYQVRRGDSLWLIASRTGTTVAELRSANNLSGDLLDVGQKLIVPAAPGGTAKAPIQNDLAAYNSTLAYRVRRGDTLWGIARKHGTKVDAIRSENDLDSDALQVGQILQISR